MSKKKRERIEEIVDWFNTDSITQKDTSKCYGKTNRLQYFYSQRKERSLELNCTKKTHSNLWRRIKTNYQMKIWENISKFQNKNKNWTLMIPNGPKWRWRTHVDLNGLWWIPTDSLDGLWWTQMDLIGHGTWTWTLWIRMDSDGYRISWNRRRTQKSYLPSSRVKSDDNERKRENYFIQIALDCGCWEKRSTTMLKGHWRRSKTIH